MMASFSYGSLIIFSSVLQRQSQSKHLPMIRSLSALYFAKKDLGRLQGLFGLDSSCVLNAHLGFALRSMRVS